VAAVVVVDTVVVVAVVSVDEVGGKSPFHTLSPSSFPSSSLPFIPDLLPSPSSSQMDALGISRHFFLLASSYKGLHW
jgi:hypothetical protein